MTRRTDDLLIDAALRDLDPAKTDALSTVRREVAGATLERILSTPAAARPVEDMVAPPRRRRRLRLLVPLALVAAAGMAVPALLLGGGTAYGSWTPTPERLTGVAAVAAAATCRASLGAPDRGERIAVAEQRGKWTYVLLSGAGTEAMCLMPNDLVKKGGTGPLYAGSYSPDAPAPPHLAPDRIVEETSGEGDTDEGWFNWVAGYVGKEVTGITVHTSSSPDIQASVVGNRFAAWWPGIVQSSRRPAGETWSYTVHLADGSTRRTECGQLMQRC